MDKALICVATIAALALLPGCQLAQRPVPLPVGIGVSTGNTCSDGSSTVPTVGFDDAPPESAEIVPGTIAVIYRNVAMVRIVAGQPRVTAASSSDAAAINEILTRYNAVRVADTAGGVTNEEQLSRDQETVSQKLCMEVPHKRSVHYYYFPETADTRKIASELRRLSIVRTAYPTPKVEPG